MKKNLIASLVAVPFAFMASVSNAQIALPSPTSRTVSVNLYLDAVQTVGVNNCLLSNLVGTIDGYTLTIQSSGGTFTGPGYCAAVTILSDVTVVYDTASDGITIYGIKTTSVAGECDQDSAVRGIADWGWGYAEGTIPGTAGDPPVSVPCQFAVYYETDEEIGW